MTLPIEKRLVEVLWMPAPDVIPDRDELSARMEPFIEAHGGGDETRRDAQWRINVYWHPPFMASFGSGDSRNRRMWRKWGLKSLSNLQMRNAFHVEMVRVNESLGLATPDLEESTALGHERSAAIQREMTGPFEANAA